MEGNREYFMKEIEIIQSIINRLSSHSFLIKGWTITLVVGILLLDNISSFKIQISIALIPINDYEQKEQWLSENSVILIG